ncbi:MAG TPA: hypothetical protein VHG89_00705 [Verrucomicrobiae bacterium]|nr:hypothetical protein [Verrucomicrobiae bacterium]
MAATYIAWMVVNCNALATPQENEVLCVGDSLTAGYGGDGVTYPGVLASAGKIGTINLGKSGYIPRHIMYYFLINESENLTIEQLKNIPPKEYENRIHQPRINALRYFFINGQVVKVLQGSNYIAYRWDEKSTVDGPNTIKPRVIGDLSNKPVFRTGRWIEEGPTSPPKKLPPICVLEVGPNGMEVEDVSNCLTTILDSYLKQDKNRYFLVLGLVNRLNYGSSRQEIENWARWIGQCNSYLKMTYPVNYCDMQAWFTSSGIYAGAGYKTRDWFPYATDQQVADDETDQRLGLMPRSLHAQISETHFNGIGYKCIGILVHNILKEKQWLSE